MATTRPNDPHRMSVNKDAQAMLMRAQEEGIVTAWDRLAEV